MKTTGIVRRIDELGRIVLPIELRRSLGINIKDPMEIYIDSDRIILKKCEDSCVFCERKDNLKEYLGKNICKDCIEKLNNK